MEALESAQGYVHSYETFGAVDGPGIRFVVFLQGCPLRCRYCHNPDTWKQGAGQAVTAQEVVGRILPYRHYLRRGGVTLSGGEPLMQHDFTLELLQRLRNHGLHTAVDTSGSLPLSKTHDLLDAADLILLDIKELNDRDCIVLTGLSSRNARDTLDYCRAQDKPVWIRHVLVPGITLMEDKLRALADYLQLFPNVRRIDLLPFHKLGEYKWVELNEPYSLSDTPQPTSAEVLWAQEIFQRRNLPINGQTGA